MAELDQAVSKLNSTPADAQAWEELFTLTWPYVLASAFRSLSPQRGRMAQAEDLAQEAFLRLARSWRTRKIFPRNGKMVLALLGVMTRRLAMDHMRREHRQRRDARMERSLTDGPEPAQDSNGLAQTVCDDLLDLAARKLTDDDREILDKRLQGYTVAQIAEGSNLSIRGVERKLLLIKNLMHPYLEIED